MGQQSKTNTDAEDLECICSKYQNDLGIFRDQENNRFSWRLYNSILSRVCNVDVFLCKVGKSTMVHYYWHFLRWKNISYHWPDFVFLQPNSTLSNPSLLRTSGSKVHTEAKFYAISIVMINTVIWCTFENKLARHFLSLSNLSDWISKWTGL